MAIPRRALTAVAAAFVCALAGAAAAGSSPVNWTRVTQPGLRNIDQISLARTGDGVLHLAWVKPRPGGSADLMHGTITAAGAVGPQAPALANWSSLANPTILNGAEGLQLLFAGVRSSTSSDPYAGGTVYRAQGGAAGAAWTLDANPVAPPSSAYSSDVVAAALDGSGGLVTAWASTSSTAVHRGDDPSTPATPVQAACCGYQTGLARDGATGGVALAWFSNATGQQGWHARAVSPALGVDRYLPGSGDAARANAVPPSQQAAVSGRIGAPGVYVLYGTGYPTWTGLSLINASTGQVRPQRLPDGTTVRRVALAAAPAGRLWLAWYDGNAVWVTRTNGAATSHCFTVGIPLPAGATDVWQLKAEGSAGPLDLLVSATVGGSIAYWHDRVEPALCAVWRTALTATTQRVSLSDAGDPVAGVRVLVDGRPVAVDERGEAQFTLAPGRHRFLATAPGYRPWPAEVTVPAQR